MILPTKTRCKHPDCLAPIAFGLTAKGRRMPLDVEPAEPTDGLHGLQIFVDRSQIRQATVDDVTAGARVYRPHFATCPGMASFRETR